MIGTLYRHDIKHPVLNVYRFSWPKVNPCHKLYN